MLLQELAASYTNIDAAARLLDLDGRCVYVMVWDRGSDSLDFLRSCLAELDQNGRSSCTSPETRRYELAHRSEGVRLVGKRRDECLATYRLPHLDRPRTLPRKRRSEHLYAITNGRQFVATGWLRGSMERRALTTVDYRALGTVFSRFLAEFCTSVTNALNAARREPTART